jgi:hypothetical protein
MSESGTDQPFQIQGSIPSTKPIRGVKQIIRSSPREKKVKNVLNQERKSIKQPARLRTIFRARSIVDYICVNYGLPRSGARHRALAQTIGNARGLDINSPRSAENHSQDLRFRRHQQRDNPNNARGLNNNFASDRGCDSTTATRLHLRLLRLRCADHAAHDKS